VSEARKSYFIIRSADYDRLVDIRIALIDSYSKSACIGPGLYRYVLTEKISSVLSVFTDSQTAHQIDVRFRSYGPQGIRVLVFRLVQACRSVRPIVSGPYAL
jgi:hypothetical protein